MSAYYNEFDPQAAAWLRELIRGGYIADGEVDQRSIVDVRADELRGFAQCHFFAGIGGWSYALRLAGWPDDRPGWTGSCPCQPYSLAGSQAGGNDARDLWPTWFQLIAQCRPHVVYGEQVESAIKHGWIDRVCVDMEAQGYAVCPVGLPSAGVGAHDKRQRLWFVAESDGRRQYARSGNSGHAPIEDEEPRRATAGDRAPRPLADYDGERQLRQSEAHDDHGQQSSGHDVDGCGDARDRLHTARLARAGVMVDPTGQGRERLTTRRPTRPRGEGSTTERAGEASDRFWDACDWIACRDGKYRAVEPGTFPLAYGIPARVGRLRGYGNAINPWVAKEIISTYMEIC